MRDIPSLEMAHRVSAGFFQFALAHESRTGFPLSTTDRLATIDKMGFSVCGVVVG